MTGEIEIFRFDVPRFIKFHPDAGCADIFNTIFLHRVISFVAILIFQASTPPLPSAPRGGIVAAHPRADANIACINSGDHECSRYDNRRTISYTLEL